MSNPEKTNEDPVARMRRLRGERRAPAEDVMSRVLSAYLGTARDKQVGEEIDTMIDSFLLAEEAARTNARRVGRLREGRALTVIGESGAGKSRTLDRQFLTREEFTGYGDREMDCVLVSVTAPSPCTLRLLGMNVLAALGYETTRDLKENVVWDMVHHQLALRGVRFLHIDELQHVLQSRNDLEIRKVQDTLKRLMQDRDWPVWLILSGLPSIRKMLSGDQQIWRRTRHILFDDLTLTKDAKLVRKVIKYYAHETAGLTIDGLTGDNFVATLLHAAINRFGIVIELTQDAIRQALQRGASALEVVDFAAAYQARTGCRPDRNIFEVEPAQRAVIDPRRALEREDTEEGPERTKVNVRKAKAPRVRRSK